MAGNNAYRMDGRTKEQFIADIKRGTQREQEAIELFQDFIYWEFGWTQPIQENGIDMNGGYIEDMDNVDASADYSVGGMPLEVKTCPIHGRMVYIKEAQINSYIKQGAALLYVNGLCNHTPVFTFWKADQLEEFKYRYKVVTPPNNINGGKKSYEIPASLLSWLTFQGKEKRYD